MSRRNVSTRSLKEVQGWFDTEKDQPSSMNPRAFLLQLSVMCLNHTDTRSEDCLAAKAYETQRHDTLGSQQIVALMCYKMKVGVQEMVALGDGFSEANRATLANIIDEALELIQEAILKRADEPDRVDDLFGDSDMMYAENGPQKQGNVYYSEEKARVKKPRKPYTRRTGVKVEESNDTVSEQTLSD